MKIDEGKVSVEKGRAHFVPVGHVLHKLGLVGQSENVHVGRNVDVKDVESVSFAEVVSHSYKAGGACLGDPVVNYNQLLVEPLFLSAIVPRFQFVLLPPLEA